MCAYSEQRVDAHANERDHTYEQTGVHMYRFLCINGHSSWSAAKDHAGGCPCCREGAYRVVTGAEALDAGINLSDCTRETRAEDGFYELHLRTGFAYRRSDLFRTMRTERTAPVSIPITRVAR
jgi:hypothetical protein